MRWFTRCTGIALALLLGAPGAQALAPRTIPVGDAVKTVNRPTSGRRPSASVRIPPRPRPTQPEWNAGRAAVPAAGARPDHFRFRGASLVLAKAVSHRDRYRGQPRHAGPSTYERHRHLCGLAGRIRENDHHRPRRGVPYPLRSSLARRSAAGTAGRVGRRHRRDRRLRQRIGAALALRNPRQGPTHQSSRPCAENHHGATRRGQRARRYETAIGCRRPCSRARRPWWGPLASPGTRARRELAYASRIARPSGDSRSVRIRVPPPAPTTPPRPFPSRHRGEKVDTIEPCRGPALAARRRRGSLASW